MVHMPEMRDLVGGDIVEHAWRCQDQAPREHQVALRRARTPTGTRVLERQPPEIPADGTGVSLRCGGQALAGKLLQKRHHGRSGNACRGLDYTVRKPGSRLGPSHDHARFAFDRNLHADIDQHRARPSFDRACNPLGLPLGEFSCRAQVHACRHGQSHPAIKIRHPQAQSARSRGPPDIDPCARHRIQPHVLHCFLPVRSLARNWRHRATTDWPEQFEFVAACPSRRCKATDRPQASNPLGALPFLHRTGPDFVPCQPAGSLQGNRKSAFPGATALVPIAGRRPAPFRRVPMAANRQVSGGHARLRPGPAPGLGAGPAMAG